MISIATYHFSTTLTALYATALGILLTKLFNSLRARKYFHGLDWIPAYISVLVVFSVYQILLLVVMARVLPPLESAAISGFVGPVAICLYFVFLSRYAKDKGSRKWLYVGFGVPALILFADFIYYLQTGLSFTITASSETPKTYFLQHFGSKNEMKPLGFLSYSMVFSFSMYYGFKYFLRFFRAKKRETLLLIGIGCNIVFQLNDMLTTFDVFPLIPLFGLAILPEIFHIDDVISRTVAHEKYELSTQLENQKLIAYHQSKLAAIGEISASIGHEISNPLAISDAVIMRLKRHLTKLEITDTQIEGYFEKYEIATKRIAKIISGFRTLSRSDSKEKEKFDLVKSTNETITFAKDFYRSLGINLEFDCKIPEGLVLGFEGRIQQCILNLMANARDAVEQNTGEKNILVRIHSENGFFKISVEDNGCGISEENKSKIFEPYFSTKDSNRGTGLGLALVHMIIHKEHSGEIDFTTSPSGTTFTIQLAALKT